MFAPEARPLPPRLTSLDAYRGFVMLLMVSGGLGFAAVAQSYEGPEWAKRVWELLGREFSHAPWVGCTLWDLIQPSFMFIVGVAMPFSYAARRARGHSFGRMFGHALLRAVVLVLLAILLSSNGQKQTVFSFTNVLAQIGLGYIFVFLLMPGGFFVELLAAAAILGGYWYLFYQHPLPGPDFDYASVGLDKDWPLLSGLAAHWNKNTNFAAWADQWLLNLFPRPKPFKFNPGGYQTLNFVPSIATMLFGVMAGQLLRKQRAAGAKLARLLAGGLFCLAAALAVDPLMWPVGQAPYQSLCPIVKRIWTPSWAVYSTGWTLLLLALFFWLIEMRGYRRWSLPLVVVGMNSITMYMMAQLMKPWVRQTLKTHIGQHIFDGLYGPIVQRLSVLLVLWLICLWLYRQRIFVRI